MSAEVLVVRCGLVPYDEAARRPALAARRARGRLDPRRAAAARAPPRLHPRAPLRRRRSCRWRPSGTRCRGSRCATPTAAAASPTTGPGQLVAYPIVDLRPYGDDVHEYVRRLEQVAISALGEHGVARADDRGPDRGLDRGRAPRAARRAPARRARSARSASTSAAGSPPTASRSTSATTCSPSSGSCPAGSRAARSAR